MIFRTHTLHARIVVDFTPCARGAFMGGSVIVLVVGAYCAILTIVVWVPCRTVLTLFAEDIVYLLIRTGLAFQISEVPVLGMLTFYTLDLVPKQILGLIASTFLKSVVVHTSTRAILADSVFLVLSHTTKRTAAIRQNILKGFVNTRTSLVCFDVDLFLTAIHLQAGLARLIILGTCRANLASSCYLAEVFGEYACYTICLT